MAILTVTTRADEAFDGGETTASADGQGLSLREAIALANSGDTITLQPYMSGTTAYALNTSSATSGQGTQVYEWICKSTGAALKYAPGSCK